MGDDKLTPVRDERAVRDDRVVEEPAGFDSPTTERIPAQGDLSDRRIDADTPEDSLDETEPVTNRTDPVTDRADSMTTQDEQVTDFTEPEPAFTEPEAEPIAASAVPETPAGFFDGDAVSRFQDRWRELQSDFVDDPARAVRGADELVDEVIRELAERKHGLDEQWRGGPDDTEELRVAMREYRSFFNQLLNA